MAVYDYYILRRPTQFENGVRLCQGDLTVVRTNRVLFVRLSRKDKKANVQFHSLILRNYMTAEVIF
jgi:hypothetical protein